MLRRLEAETEPVDPLELYLGDAREVEGRPWVMVNMISSLDGASTAEGKTAGLGDDDDKVLFRALRAVPDVILVGAGTVVADDYGPVKLDAERRERRAALGMSEVPTLAIVSGRLSIKPEARVFSDPDHKPLIITGTTANPGKLATLGDAADIAFLEETTPPAILQHLAAARIVLLEGGPSLIAQFAAAGLIDEINLTIASSVRAGEASRITTGPEIMPPLQMRPDRVLLGDHSLFIRYLTRRPIEMGG